MRSWSLVVPMWQEASRIGATVATLADSKLAHPDIELIFVDDGSTDSTARLCEQALSRHRLDASVRRLPTNHGKGAAVRHGILSATGKVVGFSDADLSCDPDDIVSVLSVVSDGEADVAVASRTNPGSTLPERQPLPRRLAGAAFNLQLRALGLTAMKDTQCGLKAFTADAARRVFEPMRTTRYAFDVEVLARARQAGLSVREVPVTWRHVEASRVRAGRDGGRMVADALAIRLRLARGR